MRSPRRWSHGPVLLLALAGCGSLPPATGAATAGLPGRFQAWTLFDVGGQLVYAVDADDAEDAAALATAAGDDFRKRTGREPDARVLVIADHDVWLPGDDPCRRLALAREGDAALHPPRATAGDAADVTDATDETASGTVVRSNTTPASCEELRAKAAEIGVEPRDMLGLIAHAVPLARLVDEFGLPADAGAAWDWAVLLPAEDCVDDGMERLLSAAMDKEMSFAQRLLAAPLMPFIRGVAVDEVLATQKSLLFELHAMELSDWSPEQRAQLVRDYADALERDVEDAAPPPGMPPRGA